MPRWAVIEDDPTEEAIFGRAGNGEPWTNDANFDPLELLARDDKWFVSGARALLYAPPFPVYDEHPGCWDAAHYLHFPLEPLFTYALVGEDGRALKLRFTSRHWRPDRLERRFSAPGIELIETQVMLPDDVLVSQVRLRELHGRVRSLRLVAWTAQPIGDHGGVRHGAAGTATSNLNGGLEGYGRRDGALGVTRTVTGSRQQRLALSLALALGDARSFAAQLSEPTTNHPHWRLTPFCETLSAEGLPNEQHLSGVTPGGLLYLALERPLHLEAHGVTQVKIVASVASDLDRALTQASAAARHADPLGSAERGWRDWFAAAPVFRCADAYFERAYYHRLYGLRLNAIDPQEGNYQHPVICEGIGYFRVPVSYSMTAQVRELRWLRDPRLAEGVMLTALEAQTEAGTFPAHLYLDWKSETEIYHADWGGALEGLHRIHPQTSQRLSLIYAGLSRYAEFLQRERDPRHSGLIEIVNQWETGQEYMSRYFAADETADLWQAMRARLQGVDSSVYAYQLFQTLERFARMLQHPAEADDWRAAADQTRAALLNNAWDADRDAFYDLAPSGQRSQTLHAVSFYPYMTDIVGEMHLPGLRAHLLNPEEFWTPYPAPSSSLKDPHFSATSLWKGKRHNCPWNGRVWPMTNSHIADALLGAARLDPSLLAVTVEFVDRFIKMMFDGGDLNRPNAFEHYHPFTGQPSSYRGIDDYMHSYILDLIVRCVVGVNVDGQRVRVDPLPFGVAFSLRGLRVRGHDLDISGDGTGFSVVVNGAKVAQQVQGHPVELEF